MSVVDRQTRYLINTAPDILTRNYWLLKAAIQDKAHPRIIDRIRKIYEGRLFLEDKMNQEEDNPWAS